MPTTSTRPHRPPAEAGLPRVCQISEYHCGPAVLQMLLARCGVHADQERLTELAHVQSSIELHGVRVDQLAAAVRALRAGVRLWCKERAGVDDLIALLHVHRCPAGVEWQGLFEEREEDEDADEGDYGHYSIVTAIDPQRNRIALRDPYPEFCAADRRFALDWFVTRWWDVNLRPLGRSGALTYVEDRRLLFVVADKAATFPAALGLRLG